MDTEIAWLAGLLEGEGSFSIAKERYCYISLSMTDVDVIAKVHSMFGGNINGPYTTNRKKPIWTWRLSNSPDVLCLLKLIRPWMMSRRRVRIDESITVLENRNTEVHHDCNGDHILSERFSYCRTEDSKQQMSKIKRKHWEAGMYG